MAFYLVSCVDASDFVHAKLNQIVGGGLGRVASKLFGEVVFKVPHNERVSLQGCAGGLATARLVGGAKFCEECTLVEVLRARRVGIYLNYLAHKREAPSLLKKLIAAVDVLAEQGLVVVADHAYRFDLAVLL